MKKLLLIALLTIAAAAEVPDKAPKPTLTDAFRARLYKALAETASAQTRLTAAQADAQAKSDAFKALMDEGAKICGAPVTEDAGKMADCPAPQPKEKAK